MVDGLTKSVEDFVEAQKHTHTGTRRRRMQSSRAPRLLESCPFCVRSEHVFQYLGLSVLTCIAVKVTIVQLILVRVLFQFSVPLRGIGEIWVIWQRHLEPAPGGCRRNRSGARGPLTGATKVDLPVNWVRVYSPYIHP